MSKLTHILAYLAGIVTAVLLLWGWVGAELSRMGQDAGESGWPQEGAKSATGSTIDGGLGGSEG